MALAVHVPDPDHRWRAVRLCTDVPLRTRELEPCIEECRTQYQVASRLHSVRELDWRMESGER